MPLPYKHCVVKELATDELVARVPMASGDTVYAALSRASVPIRTRCRGSTLCGLCWVRVEEGAEDLQPIMADEQRLLERTASGVEGARLACRITLPAGRGRLVVSARLGPREDEGAQNTA